MYDKDKLLEAMGGGFRQHRKSNLEIALKSTIPIYGDVLLYKALLERKLPLERNSRFNAAARTLMFKLPFYGAFYVAYRLLEDYLK